MESLLNKNNIQPTNETTENEQYHRNTVLARLAVRVQNECLVWKPRWLRQTENCSIFLNFDLYFQF